MPGNIGTGLRSWKKLVEVVGQSVYCMLDTLILIISHVWGVFLSLWAAFMGHEIERERLVLNGFHGIDIYHSF